MIINKNAIVKAFWNCGDNDIIDFAILKARLNRQEKEVLRLILDECMTQEQASEVLYISNRHLQNIWKSATDKLVGIPWLVAYGLELMK